MPEERIERAPRSLESTRLAPQHNACGSQERVDAAQEVLAGVGAVAEREALVSAGGAPDVQAVGAQVITALKRATGRAPYESMGRCDSAFMHWVLGPARVAR